MIGPSQKIKILNLWRAPQNRSFYSQNSNIKCFSCSALIEVKRGQLWPKPLWDKSVVPVGNLWGNLWGNFWEPLGNLMRTHWEHTHKKKPPQNWPLVCMLHCLKIGWAEFLLLPFVCHHFQPWLMDRGLIPLINVKFQCKKCSVKTLSIPCTEIHWENTGAFVARKLWIPYFSWWRIWFLDQSAISWLSFFVCLNFVAGKVQAAREN